MKRNTQPSEPGRLQARPRLPEITPTEVPVGLQPLAEGEIRDALVYVPASYRADQPAPLALMLHGAGGNAHHGITLLQQLADAAGMIVIAPKSRRETWDVIFGRYGPDITVIDQMLRHVFGRFVIDPARVAIGGFSDGASYALSVGITNGDLFTHILAFSPGFMVPADQQGEPRIFISHGVHDQVLPIEPCSRRIVPQLERADYDVTYHEFDGPHTVPANIAQLAVTWFVTKRA